MNQRKTQTKKRIKMSKNSAVNADFRYDTGAAKVSWAAVGENVGESEIGRIIRFLYPPIDGRKRGYEAEFKRLEQQLKKLSAFSGQAGRQTVAGK